MSTTVRNIETFFPDLVKYEIESMNQVGQNFSGSLLRITIFLKNGKNLSIVAKQTVENEFMREFSNINFTFKNELNFYQHILPTLNTFLKNANHPELSFFPSFLGGRLNLNNKSTPDSDAIILLEDLKLSGFEHKNKYQGFDLEEMKFILEKLAHFHAASLGLKLTNPKKFQEEIGPHFDEFYIRQIRKNEDVRACEEKVQFIIKTVEEDEASKSKINELIKMIRNCSINLKRPKNCSYFSQTPFSTLIHGDLWFNNLLAKYKDGKMSEVIFLDLQNLGHASVARDLLFLIFLNSNEQVLLNNFQDLLSFYYNQLSTRIKAINGKMAYSFEIFNNEMKNIAIEQAYLDCTVALGALFPKENFQREISETTQESILSCELSEIAKKRIRQITKVCLNQNWI